MINFICYAVLHVIGIVDVVIHCKRGGGMTEANLYLLCTDLLFGEKRRMGVPERVKPQIFGEFQLSL